MANATPQAPGSITPNTPLGVNPLALQDAAYGPAVDNTPQDIAASIGHHMKAAAPVLASIPDTGQSQDQSQPLAAGQSPFASPQAADPPAPLPDAAPQEPDMSRTPLASDPEIPITGDGWRPEKNTTLHKLADLFLGRQFGSDLTDDRNKAGAMQHFFTNPQESVRRMMQVDPKVGIALADKVQDNQRLDSSAEMQKMYKQEKIKAGLVAHLGPINSMFLADGKTPDEAARAKAWGLLAPSINSQARKLGIGEDMLNLPDEYSPLSLQSAIAGEIPLPKQATNALSALKESDTVDNRKVVNAQHDKGLVIQQQNANAHTQSVSQTGAHMKVSERQAQNRENRMAAKATAKNPMPIYDKKTGKQIGQRVNNIIKVIGSDGNFHHYDVTAGTQNAKQID